MLKNNNIKKLSFFLILLLQDQFFLLRGVYLDECSRLIALDASESLAYLSRERVEIIDTKTLETRHQLDQSVHGMVALDRERFITTSPNDCGIYLWSGSSHALVGELLGHDRPISAIVVDRDAKLLLSGDTSGTIYLWDLSSHTCIQTLKTPEVIYDFLFIDDQTIAVASYNEIYIFNLLTGQLLKKLVGHRLMIWALALVTDNDKKMLLSGSFDCSIRLWDLETCNSIQKITTDWFISEPIISFIFCTGDRILVEDRKRYQMLSLETGVLSSLSGDLFAPEAIFAPERQPFLIVSRTSGNILIIEKASLKKRKSLKSSTRYSLTQFTLFNNGSCLAAAGWSRDSLATWPLEN